MSYATCDQYLSLTYQCLILDRWGPLIGDGVKGCILLGSYWISKCHDVTLVDGGSISFKFCDETRVLGIFKEFAYFLVFFSAGKDIMFFLTTLTIAADLSVKLKTMLSSVKCRF